MHIDTGSFSQRGDGTLGRVIKVSLIVVLAAITGASITFAYLRYKQDPYSWHKLDIDKTSFTTESLIDSDIPLPDIRNVSGEMKFRTGRGNTSDLEAGYVVEFDIDKLNKDKLPGKYRKPTCDQVGFKRRRETVRSGAEAASKIGPCIRSYVRPLCFGG